MPDKTVSVLMRTGTIALGFLFAWLYRLHSRGDSLTSKRVLYGVLMLLAAFLLAVAWQARSKVPLWSWWMTFLAYTASLIGISLATVVVVKAML
jgi:hypothetical protein